MSRLAIIFCLALSLLTVGCARMVTDKADLGTEIDFMLTFSGNINTISNHYYILFPRTNTGFLPAPVEEGDPAYPFFAGPKDTIFNLSFSDTVRNAKEGTEYVNLAADPMGYFYTNYYCNWYDYIDIHQNAVNIYTGTQGDGFPVTGSVETQVQTTSVVNLSGQQTTQIIFSLDQSKLSKTYEKNEPVLFYILTTTGEFTVVDWMPNVGIIENQSGAMIEGDDDAFHQRYEEIPESLNLINWKVNVR